jgi:hypothetical protein
MIKWLAFLVTLEAIVILILVLQNIKKDKLIRKELHWKQ